MNRTVNALIFEQFQDESASRKHHENAMKLLALLPSKTRAYYEHAERLLKMVDCGKGPGDLSAFGKVDDLKTFLSCEFRIPIAYKLDL